MGYDIIHVSGKPHVLIPLHEFTAMKNGGSSDNALPDDVKEKLALAQDNPIKIIRKFRGLTQDDLAQAAGISRPYLTEIETGRKNGSVKAMRALADALNVTLDSLAA
jgi:DNA-binding XRE family transcriptional regulator